MKKSIVILGILLTAACLPVISKGEKVTAGTAVTGGAVGVETPAPTPVGGGTVTPVNPPSTPTEPQINPALAPLAGLTVKADSGLKSSKVSWTPYAGALSYVVYRKEGNGAYQWIKTLAATSFTDTGLNPGATYTYQVQAKLPAVSGGYELSSFSAETVVKMKPAKVKKFKAKAHRGYNILTWAKGSKNVSGYEVWGKVKVKLKGVKLSYHKMKTIKSRKKTKLKHKMLVKGMTYQYKIRCYTKVGGKKIYSDYVTIQKKAR